eukprot:1751349-Ditylum_brightwellii.AAC.1
MLCAGMEQTLATNNKCNKIFKIDCSPLCCLFQKKDKMVRHIVSSCCKLTGTKYTKRHIDVAQHHKHSPIPSVVDGNITITWDLKMVVDKKLEHNCPDIVAIDKEEHTAQIINIVNPST